MSWTFLEIRLARPFYTGFLTLVWTICQTNLGEGFKKQDADKAAL